MGVKSKKPQEEQPSEGIVIPPYSPVNDDPNLSKMSPAPQQNYHLKSAPHRDSPVLLLRSVDEITREFWSFSSKPREDSYVLQALYYLSLIFRFRT